MIIENEIIIGDKIINFVSRDIVDNIDIEEAITIDYSNLIGESVLTPLLSNAVGLLKSDLEREVKELKLEIKVFEATYKSNKRKGAIDEGKKVTEKELETSFHTDEEWISLSKILIIKEDYLSKIEVFYWKLQDKMEKLNLFLKGVVPKEYSQEAVEKYLNKFFKNDL